MLASGQRVGFAASSSDPADERFTLATLTPKGLSKLDASAPGHVDAVRALVSDSLTKAQQHQLGLIARSIVDAIDASGSPAS